MCFYQVAVCIQCAAALQVVCLAVCWAPSGAPSILFTRYKLVLLGRTERHLCALGEDWGYWRDKGHALSPLQPHSLHRKMMVRIQQGYASGEGNSTWCLVTLHLENWGQALWLTVCSFLFTPSSPGEAEQWWRSFLAYSLSWGLHNLQFMCLWWWRELAEKRL